MNDEVRQAAFIGAAINSGLGGIPTGRRRKSKNKNKKEKTTTTTSTTENTATSKDSTKELPKKSPGGSKPELETPLEPIFVRSERVHREVENSAPKAISFTPEPPATTNTRKNRPNVGKQFEGYGDMYGSTHTQSPIDLSKF